MKTKTIKKLIKTGLLSDKRIFSTNKEYRRFIRSRNNLQPYEIKPRGLWYAIDDSWVEWCLSESFGGMGQYLYEVELNPKANILFLTNEDEVISFNDKYTIKEGWISSFMASFIDWPKVMNDFDGIEINPYLHHLRCDSHFLWYYGWDVPSGCLWRAIAKKRITLLAEYKNNKKGFVSL